MEELVEVLRKLWLLHEGPVYHDGRFYRVHLNPTADTPPPFRARLPIWTAGVNPRMVKAAGRVADGLVGHPMFTAEYVEEVVRPQLDAGAADAGRDPSDVGIMGILMCVVDADEERARRTLAYSISQYAASRVYDRLFDLHGWGAAQQAVRDVIRSGDRVALAAAVPDEVVDAIGVACTPDQLADRVAVHARSYDHLTLTGPPWGVSADESEQAARDILEGMRGALAAPAHPGERSTVPA